MSLPEDLTAQMLLIDRRLVHLLPTPTDELRAAGLLTPPMESLARFAVTRGS